MTAHSFRALVLVDRAREPRAVLRVKRDGSRIDGVRTDRYASASPELRRELDRYVRLRPYVFTFDALASDTEHELIVEAGDERTVLAVRTLPERLPAAGLTVAVASCYYGGFGQGAQYLRGLQQPCCFDKPLLKLLVGDNLYLDIGPNDGRDDGYDQTVWRYVEHFVRSSYADVLGHVPTLTTWDDHELWNNYPESQTWLSRSWLSGETRQGYARAGIECLDLFQNSLNPAPAAADGGRSFRYDLAPLSFFFADVRSERTLFDDRDRARHMQQQPRRMMHERDLDALVAWAKGDGPLVLVIGQPLWMPAGGGTDYNPPAFADQYARIWQALADAKRDVLVISGDVHFSRLLTLELPGRTVYEFITSPASHIPTVTTTALSAVFGGQGAQGRGTVDVPRAFPLDKSEHYTPLKPRLGRYLMGTDAQSTLALLHFTPVGNDVEVGATMVDLERNVVARQCAADNPGWFTGDQFPEYGCHAPRLFKLK